MSNVPDLAPSGIAAGTGEVSPDQSNEAKIEQGDKDLLDYLVEEALRTWKLGS